MAAQSYCDSTMEGLVSSKGRERLPTVHCVWFCISGGRTATYRTLCLVDMVGMALYYPLCSVLKNWGGTDLYRPLCSALYTSSRGRTALYRPLCSVLYIAQGGGSSLPSPVFGFIYNLVWRLGEGTVSDTPPLSGGSKLNN